jgi:hypothetical protein
MDYCNRLHQLTMLITFQLLFTKHQAGMVHPKWLHKTVVEVPSTSQQFIKKESDSLSLSLFKASHNNHRILPAAAIWLIRTWRRSSVTKTLNLNNRGMS